MQSAVDQAARFAGQLQDGNISLIELVRSDGDESAEYEHQVIFVRWESVIGDPRRARPIRLYDQSRVVYNVPFLVPVLSYRVASTKILIANVPVVMFKRVAHLRQPMPEFALLLQRVFLARRFQGPMFVGPDSVANRCSLCVRVRHHDYGSTQETFLCKCCLLAFHRPRAEFVAARSGDHGVELDWGSFVCPMCQVARDLAET